MNETYGSNAKVPTSGPASAQVESCTRIQNLCSSIDALDSITNRLLNIEATIQGSDRGPMEEANILSGSSLDTTLENGGPVIDDHRTRIMNAIDAIDRIITS